MCPAAVVLITLHAPVMPPADNNLESMFSEELKRRGLDSLDDVGSWSPADEGEQAGSARSSSSSSSCFMCAVQHMLRTDWPGTVTALNPAHFKA